MTDPDGVQVTPAELAEAARVLRATADAVSDALVHSEEPSLWNPEPYGEIMFGPADDVAAQYARLTHQLADFVTACADRLRAGADVFTNASVEFERIDMVHGKRMGNR
jgi:hypothetical protein